MIILTDDFTIDEEIHFSRSEFNGNPHWKPGHKAEFIGPGDCITLLLNEEPPAIMLFLHDVTSIIQQQFQHILINGVEELGVDAAGLAVTVLVRAAVLAGCVTFTGLLPDEFVIDGLCRVIIDRGGCFGAGLQCGTPATIGKGDDVPAVLGLDGCLVDFI